MYTLKKMLLFAGIFITYIFIKNQQSGDFVLVCYVSFHQKKNHLVNRVYLILD